MNRFFSIILTMAVGSGLACAADLTITVKGVRNGKGAVFLAVYDSEASFMKAPQAKTTRRTVSSSGDENSRIGVRG